MDFGLSDEQRHYRDRARQLVESISGEEMLAFWAEQEAVGGDRIFPWAPSAHQRLCQEGLVGITWPEPWGKGATPAEEYVLAEELVAGGYPSSPATYGSGTARQVITEATPEIVADHLPRMLEGTLRYAGGLSEPEAGSDLFALKTTAIREGDEYVVNGSKLWTSYAHESQFINTLVRTDPSSTRHRGLSLLLVPLDARGVEIHPVWVIGGWRVNQCFFDDVRVPVANRLGEENEGAAILSRGLVNERGMSFGGTESRLLLARMIHRFEEDTSALGDADLVTFGRFITQVEVERLLNISTSAKADRGEEATVPGSMGKMFGSEMAQNIAMWLSEILPDAVYQRQWSDRDGDRLANDAEWFVRGTVTVTIAGGTSEIQRNAIAQRGLGLPRGT